VNVRFSRFAAFAAPPAVVMVLPTARAVREGSVAPFPTQQFLKFFPRIRTSSTHNNAITADVLHIHVCCTMRVLSITTGNFSFASLYRVFWYNDKYF
jgi:hypothetical protein